MKFGFKTQDSRNFNYQRGESSWLFSSWKLFGCIRSVHASLPRSSNTAINNGDCHSVTPLGKRKGIEHLIVGLPGEEEKSEPAFNVSKGSHKAELIFSWNPVFYLENLSAKTCNPAWNICGLPDRGLAAARQQVKIKYFCMIGGKSWLRNKQIL